MTKKLIVVVGWIFSATITVAVCIFTVIFLRQSQTVTYTPTIKPKNTRQIFAQILGFSNASAGLKTADARPILLAQFLERHNSPLKPYPYWGGYLTQLADQYQLDYRLLPSIAMQESNLCKVIPKDTYNCLGLGIHAKGTWGFQSYEENFDAAARILKKDYIDKGYVTPEEIQKKYTPQSNGSWQYAVNHFMDRIATAEY